MTTPMPGPLAMPPAITMPPPGANTPLDLSGFASKKLDYSKLFQSIAPGQVSGLDTGDLAKAILANSKWGKAGEAPGSPHNEGLWNKITDLLSMGLYATAGGFEKGLEAHKSDPNDSVLNDIVKTGSAGVGGFLDGIGGAAFPILGLSDRLHPDGSDKTEWSQVLAKHGQFAQELQEGTQPDVLGNTVPLSEDEIKDYGRKTAVQGLGMDILLDPLNFTKLFKGAKSLDVVNDSDKLINGALKNNSLGKFDDSMDALNNSKMAQQNVVNTADEIPSAQGLPIKNTATPKPFDEVPTPTPNALPPVGGLPVPAMGGSEAAANSADLFSQMLKDSVAEHEASKIENSTGTGPAAVNYQSRLADPARRLQFAKQLAVRVTQHTTGADWTKNVLSHIQKTFPGLKAERTAGYLSQISGTPEKYARLANPAVVSKVADSLSRTLEDDWKASRGSVTKGAKSPAAQKMLRLAVPAQKVIEDIIARRGAGIGDEAGRIHIPLNAQDQQIAADVIKAHAPHIISGTFTGMKNESHVLQAVANGSKTKWSGPEQVQTWNRILSSIPYANKFGRALKILRTVEQHFIDQGHTPFSTASAAHAIPLRLSDIIAEVGPEQFAKHGDLATTLLRSAFSHGSVKGAAEAANKAPELADAINQAVSNAAAKGAVGEADAAKLGATAGDKAAEQALASNKSDARIANDISLSSRVAADIAAKAGAGLKGQKLASNIVKNVYVDSNKVQSAATRGAMNSKAALTHDSLEPKWNNNAMLTKSINAMIGGKSPHVLSTLANPMANVIGWKGARIAAAFNLFDAGFSKLGDFFGPLLNPAYANKDLRPILLQQLGSARASAAHNSTVFGQAVRQLGASPEIWDDAMKGAQGTLPIDPTHAAYPAMQLLLKHFENLFGSSGLREGAAMANTVVGRGQLLIRELNHTMERMGLKNYQFTRKIVTDAAGNSQDYSKGTDWLNSWQSWTGIKDVPRFMMNMSNAIENTMHEAAFWDDVAERFGAKIRQDNFAVPAPKTIARLKGYYFSPDHATQINTVIKALHDMRQPNSKALALFDQVLSKWKTSVTIYMPSHHIRNALGDTFMNWLAGVNNVRVYSDALKVMKAQHGRYDALEDTGELTGHDVVQRAISRSKNAAGTVASSIPKGDQVVFTMKNGMKVTADMVYTSAFKKGILPAAHQLEDLSEEDAAIQKILKFSPFEGKVRTFMNSATESREHFIRLAHYVDALRKGTGNFDKISEDAANIVRKWHPDGSDLTNFERRGIRRVMPFYSWSRKAVPLMIESLVMHPLKATAYNKAMYAIQTQNGGGDMSGTTWENPFPIDQLFPDWMRSKGIGPVMGSAGSYGIVNPSNPLLDVIDQLGNPGTTFTNLLNPAIKVPIELAQGQAMGGAQINAQNGGVSSYLAKQLPGISNFGNITNMTDTAAQQKYAAATGAGPIDIPALLNMFSAAGVQDTGKYLGQAKYDLRDYFKNKAAGG